LKVDATVARLIQLLGLPDEVDGRVPWDSSRAEVGFDFPEDFRDFIDTYGSVVLNNLLSIWSPQIAPRRFNAPSGLSGFSNYVWFCSKEGGQGILRERLRSRWPEGQPYPVWPERGGLILWGRSPRKHQCYWVTEGDDSNSWPIVVWFDETEWLRFDMSFSQFLLEVVMGESELSEELIDGGPPRDLIVEQTGGWAD
jgi:hypothetical protein